MKTLGIVLAVWLAAWACDVQAGIRHCDHCGCRRNCKKYCRLVCGTKTETKTEYSCESEDFCVPGPSQKCGVKCERDCRGHIHRSTIWKPTCAKVRTRTNLVKKEVKKEVPDYKWVVEEICRGCGHCVSRTEQAEVPSKADMNDGSDLAPASDQVAPGPDVDDAMPTNEPEPTDEPKPADEAMPADEAEPTDEADPDADEAESADREAPQAQSRFSSRLLQVLLNAK